jgi:hypothetical protein
MVQVTITAKITSFGIADQLRKIAADMDKFSQVYDEWILTDQDGCVISQLNIKTVGEE